jgi:hypothetical protein
MACSNCGSHIPSSAIAESEKKLAITIDRNLFVIVLFFISANVMKQTVL